ncbi:MAG: hypothetical protein WBI61_06630 [Bacillota bacterium]
MNSCWSLKTLFVASVGILLLTVALGGCFGGSEKATVGGIHQGACHRNQPNRPDR